ncbi:MAG: M67 family metallopeptidase [Deltaproteobacteria bacterium]|nr:M67 family metallopeptidase [Deltaproteobacteria bacterium]
MKTFLGLGKVLGGKGTIKISQAIYDQIVQHAKDSYPDECCGILIGSTMRARCVLYIHQTVNTNRERSKDRYIIDPREIYLMDKEAKAQGAEIVGFYHSHPDHPDKPSATDREWGQAGYSYMIASVNGGKDVSVRSWIFHDENDPFKEEKIKLTE